MLSCWLSDKDLENAETELFKYTGMEKDSIKSYPVNFSFDEKDWNKDAVVVEEEKTSSFWAWCHCASKNEYEGLKANCHIWTYEFGKKEKPVLVLIHGYYSSSLIFYKLFKSLSENFHVYAIDLLGMGRSARPKFNIRTSEQLELFYVNSIEKWRESVGIKSFSLLGHTFGAYVASKYCLHYSEHVSNLAMISPYGVEKKDFETLKIQQENLGFFQKWGTGCALGCMLCLVCPCTALCCLPCACCAGTYSALGDIQELLNSLGVYFGGYSPNDKLNQHLFKLSEEEHSTFYNYYKYILNKQEINGKDDLAFKKALESDVPIIDYVDKIKEKGIKILVFYAENDAFNYKAINEENKEEVSTEKRLTDRGVEVKTIERAQILINFENPKKLGEVLNESIKKPA